MNVELPVIDPISAGGGAQQAAASRWSGLGDWVGMLASVGCAIHCAAMPFVIAYLPTLGLSFLADVSFHKWMAAGCFAIALMAFVPGLQKHGRLTPVILGSFGLVMISVAAFGFFAQCCASCDSETASVVVGDVDGCTDACCNPRTNKAAPDESTDRLVPTSNRSALVPTKLCEAGGHVARWLTPLGGIVLVAAHLLNRRFGCLCGYCETGMGGVTA